MNVCRLLFTRTYGSWPIQSDHEYVLDQSIFFVFLFCFLLFYIPLILVAPNWEYTIKERHSPFIRCSAIESHLNAGLRVKN